MPDNYLSAGEHVRNLADLPGQYEIVEAIGAFRIVRIEPPFFQGYEFWVVNEKGFFWEPAESREAAKVYIESGAE
jgi:hypothetical protein